MRTTKVQFFASRDPWPVGQRETDVENHVDPIMFSVAQASPIFWINDHSMGSRRIVFAAGLPSITAI